MREMTESHWPQKAIEDAAPGLSYSYFIKEGEQLQEGSRKKKNKKQKQSNNSPWTKKSNKEKSLRSCGGELCVGKLLGACSLFLLWTEVSW